MSCWTMVFIISSVLNLFALTATDLYQKFAIGTSIWDKSHGLHMTSCQLCDCVSHHKPQMCNRARCIFNAARITVSHNIDSIYSMLRKKETNEKKGWTISKMELSLSLQKCWNSVKYSSQIRGGWYSCASQGAPLQVAHWALHFFSFSPTDAPDFLYTCRIRHNSIGFDSFVLLKTKLLERKPNSIIFIAVLWWHQVSALQTLGQSRGAQWTTADQAV